MNLGQVGQRHVRVACLLLACCLPQLTRVGAILVDRARLIDLLALACSTLLMVWVVVIGDAGQIGNIPRAYVIGALLHLAVVTRPLVAVSQNPLGRAAGHRCRGCAGE
ncbi:hypothetical protein ACIBSW_25100 [Actinoplanes sp. NPDC049668]|uniref:hypothetical protein n=1 Tax=unclassified Actinoplanes TaxID=2626549 RepID=UPI0033ACC890